MLVFSSSHENLFSAANSVFCLLVFDKGIKLFHFLLGVYILMYSTFIISFMNSLKPFSDISVFLAFLNYLFQEYSAGVGIFKNWSY